MRDTLLMFDSCRMNSHFGSIVESLEGKFRLLMQMTPVRYGAFREDLPLAGIYLFSEGDRHLYVGRSRNIRRRLGQHCTPGGSYLRGPFAFHLAREATGRAKATYKTIGSRPDLMRDAEFSAAFRKAKARIREMDIRFVAEPDPLSQTLVEIYAAVALQTPYNDFDTH
jgi:hypothetical protein